MTAKPLPDQAYLRVCFRYERSTGRLFWRKRPIEHFNSLRTCNWWNSRYAGTEVGCTHNSTERDSTHVPHIRRVTNFDGGIYMVHRLIFKLVHDRDPDLLDHANIEATDNTLTNLREATPSQSTVNQRVRSDNKTGYKGVSFIESSGRYRACICWRGKQKHIGCFSTAEEAHSAYALEADKLFGKFARY